MKCVDEMDAHGPVRLSRRLFVTACFIPAQRG
jgi:hypothetical protein